MHEALHTGWLLGWLLLRYFMMDRFEEQLCCQSHQAMECHGMLWISCFTVIVHVVFCVFYDIIIAHGWQLEPRFQDEFASHFGLPRRANQPWRQLFTWIKGL